MILVDRLTFPLPFERYAKWKGFFCTNQKNVCTLIIDQKIRLKKENLNGKVV